MVAISKVVEEGARTYFTEIKNCGKIKGVSRDSIFLFEYIPVLFTSVLTVKKNIFGR
jgi:hypothetical protein